MSKEQIDRNKIKEYLETNHSCHFHKGYWGNSRLIFSSKTNRFTLTICETTFWESDVVDIERDLQTLGLNYPILVKRGYIVIGG